jgi:hypothetical protein
MSWAGTLTDFNGDGVRFTGAGNSDTSPSFSLLGGKYLLSTQSSGTASAQLQFLLPDGSTYQNVGSAATAGVTQALDLPAGRYQLVMGGAAGTAQGSLVRVPYRAA